LSRLVRGSLALLARLQHRRVVAVVGHDFGSPVAAWCALLHPDIFGCVALLSAPFAGPPHPGRDPWPQIDAALAALQPPRKQYQRYYTTREANAEMHASAQGLSAFLRAYFHCNSHDWPHNHPHALKSWRAEDLAALPRYYVMDLDKGMAATAADMAPSPEEVERCTWLTDAELQVYAREFGRTGFQGALNWYRNTFDAGAVAELQAFNGHRIEVPACFIGRSGALPSRRARAMSSASPPFGPCFIEEAGRGWQEQPHRLDATLEANSSRVTRIGAIHSRCTNEAISAVATHRPAITSTRRNVVWAKACPGQRVARSVDGEAHDEASAASRIELDNSADASWLIPLPDSILRPSCCARGCGAARSTVVQPREVWLIPVRIVPRGRELTCGVCHDRRSLRLVLGH
jgi:pimeloyl-ACP methyl ester carboxylesterase